MLFFHFSDWKLANAADTLFNALRDLAHTIITWSVSSQLEQDHAWQVLKGVAYAAVNEAKLFLKVRAGCNIVQNKRGKDQIDQASCILTKGQLPGKLASALRHCISVHGGGGLKRQPPQCIQNIVAAPPKRQKFGVNVAANAASVSEHPGASSSMSFSPKANSCKSGCCLLFFAP